MSSEPGTPKLVMPRLIVRRYTLGANCFGRTSIPMKHVAAGGKGSVFQLRRSRLSHGFGVIRDPVHGRERYFVNC
jgi:hypothetical protein